MIDAEAGPRPSPPILKTRFYTNSGLKTTLLGMNLRGLNDKGGPGRAGILPNAEVSFHKEKFRLGTGLPIHLESRETTADAGAAAHRTIKRLWEKSPRPQPLRVIR